jgi:hypothetical protein
LTQISARAAIGNNGDNQIFRSLAGRGGRMKKRTRKLLKALMQEIIELRARVRVLEGRLRNLKIASVKGSRVVLLKSERPPEDAA